MLHQRKILLRALNQLRKGALTIKWPDGKTTTYIGEEPGSTALMQVSRWEVFDDLIREGDVGLGVDYGKRWWDTPDLASFMRFAVENLSIFEAMVRSGPVLKLLMLIKQHLQVNTPDRSRENVQKHYDLGNDFYRLWLDEGMTYSCGLFNADADLDLKDAQKAKYARILDRLAPGPGERLLDIGCGWGGFMQEAASRKCHITGVTLSDEQAEYATKRLLSAGMKDLTDVRLQDYRELSGPFDKVASIGMFEHVGEACWPTFMEHVHDYLKPGGRAMIQTIIVPHERFEIYRNGNNFLREHIFPGSMLPTRERFENEAVISGLTVNDVFHFGQDYAITLDKWLANFENRINEIKALGYDENFIRKWRFYLSSCAAMFRSGMMDVIQVELARKPAQ